jgi:esterase/lipase
MDTSSILFIHGSTIQKSQTYKAKVLRHIFPDIVTPDFDGTLTERMNQLVNITGKQMGWLLIGSSLGGLMAAIFAALHPDQVRQLVLLAPALTLPEFSASISTLIETPTVIIQGTQDELITVETSRGIAEKVFSHLIYLVVDDNHSLERTADTLDWKTLLE